MNDAPMIVGENIATLPPAPTGGTILDGVYERTPYTTTGTTLRLRETCPSTGISPYDGYSVSGDTVTFSSSTLRRALVLERR